MAVSKPNLRGGGNYVGWEDDVVLCPSTSPQAQRDDLDAPMPTFGHWKQEQASWGMPGYSNAFQQLQQKRRAEKVGTLGDGLAAGTGANVNKPSCGSACPESSLEQHSVVGEEEQWDTQSSIPSSQQETWSTFSSSTAAFAPASAAETSSSCHPRNGETPPAPARGAPAGTHAADISFVGWNEASPPRARVSSPPQRRPQGVRAEAEAGMSAVERALGNPPLGGIPKVAPGRPVLGQGAASATAHQEEPKPCVGPSGSEKNVDHKPTPIRIQPPVAYRVPKFGGWDEGTQGDLHAVERYTEGFEALRAQRRENQEKVVTASGILPGVSETTEPRHKAMGFSAQKESTQPHCFSIFSCFIAPSSG